MRRVVRLVLLLYCEYLRQFVCISSARLTAPTEGAAVSAEDRRRCSLVLALDPGLEAPGGIRLGAASDV